MESSSNKKQKAIHDPANKLIMNNGKAFCKHMQQKLIQFDFKYKPNLKSAFQDSLLTQQRLGSIFSKVLLSATSGPYTKDHLHFPWPNAPKYKILHSLFLFLPLATASFLSKAEPYFYMPVLKAWRETQDVSYFPNSSDYYARALPGSSNKARSIAVENGKLLNNSIKLINPAKVRDELLAGNEQLQNKRWAQFGGSLFPIGYMKGEAFYGWLRSIPGSTVCNMNREVKGAILSAIKDHTGISFFEVDLKGCHGTIFEDLFDWSRFDRSDLPSLENLWPEMIKDFWEKANLVDSYPEIWSQIEKWGDDLLKGLLKNQFYKALNGGLPEHSEANIEWSKIKLSISDKDEKEFNEYLFLVFSQMKVFTLETNFKEQLNSFPVLYLPNHTESFPVATLSKKQYERLIKDPEATFRMQTSNSRLFSNMELCLIFHLLASLSETKIPWIIVGYEADGVLMAADSAKDTVLAEFEKLNQHFKESIKSLTTAKHSLDLKNYR